MSQMFHKRLFFLGFVIGTLCLPELDNLFAAPTIKKIGDSIIDADALHFTNGSWGVCVNGQSFQQDALTTFNDFQYATYYDSAGRVCVARRQSRAEHWEILRFADHRFRGNDTHNVAVIGICARDGTIHLAFDHHNHPLHYRVSLPGVALHPDKFAWTTNLFGAITSELEPGKKLTRVTYPRFFRTPEGGLHFGCRIGSSGDGDKCLADYDPATGTWKDFGACFGSTGNYHGELSRNPYLNGYTYDSKHRLHTTWCWRENGGPSSNHDLAYAWSRDGGKTWLNNDGCEIGARGERLVTIDSPGLHPFRIGMNRGLINAATQAIDSRNHIHAVTAHLPDNMPDEPNWEAAKQKGHYFHYWREDNGQWHRNEMQFIAGRPQLWFDKSDNAYIVFVGDRYNPSPNLTIAAATAKSRWSNWKIIHAEPGPFSGQPQIDHYNSRDILSVYIQEAPKSGTATATPLRVLDFQP